MIKSELNKIANLTKASLLGRYFQTQPGGYGEGDVFIGLTVPQVREVAEKYWDNISLEDTEDLLHSKIHEHRFCALVILVKKFRKYSKYLLIFSGLSCI